MSAAPNTIERAYELARSGDCANVQEIRKRLKAEGFSGVMRHLDGHAIQQALIALCAAAKVAPPPSDA